MTSVVCIHVLLETTLGLWELSSLFLYMLYICSYFLNFLFHTIWSRDLTADRCESVEDVSPQTEPAALLHFALGQLDGNFKNNTSPGENVSPTRKNRTRLRCACCLQRPPPWTRPLRQRTTLSLPYTGRNHQNSLTQHLLQQTSTYRNDLLLPHQRKHL